MDSEAQQKPARGVEEENNELLYTCLHRNLDENGQDSIAEYTADGVKAWRASNMRFRHADTGTTMDKFYEHITKKWEGGDKQSFIEFLTKWDKTSRPWPNKTVSEYPASTTGASLLHSCGAIISGQGIPLSFINASSFHCSYSVQPRTYV